MAPTHSTRSTGSEDKRAPIDSLLKKAAESTGAESAEALREAARLVRGQAAPLRAARLYERAIAQLSDGDRRLAAQIELQLGALYEQDLGLYDQAMRAYER